MAEVQIWCCATLSGNLSCCLSPPQGQGWRGVHVSYIPSPTEWKKKFPSEFPFKHEASSKTSSIFTISAYIYTFQFNNKCHLYSKSFCESVSWLGFYIWQPLSLEVSRGTKGSQMMNTYMEISLSLHGVTLCYSTRAASTFDPTSYNHWSLWSSCSWKIWIYAAKALPRTVNWSFKQSRKPTDIWRTSRSITSCLGRSRKWFPLHVLSHFGSDTNDETQVRGVLEFHGEGIILCSTGRPYSCLDFNLLQSPFHAVPCALRIVIIYWSLWSNGNKTSWKLSGFSFQCSSVALISIR